MTVARAIGREFQDQLDAFASQGPVTLGPSASHLWRTDPRRMPIVLSRYKFVAKMLEGKARAIEIGCGDGFQMRVVLQAVTSVHGVDYDPSFIEWATKHAAGERLNATFGVCDLIHEAPPGEYDAAYSLDVIEHIPFEHEAAFLRNIASVLPEHGMCIIGTPNITADPYASKWSKEGHINLKSAQTLRQAMAAQFHNVLLFSMNDEVVHTGFAPMAHYLLAIGIGVRR